jgi:hypothetical protein
MSNVLAVGGSRAPVVSSGWDLWPLVGIALALWIGRRILQAPWRAPLFTGLVAAALVFPLAVHAWGVIPAHAAALLSAFALHRTRRDGPGRRSTRV